MSRTKSFSLPLSPLDMTTEGLAGLIMAMSVTGSVAIASSSVGEASMVPVIAGALGGNIAWGTIDAVLLLLTQIGKHARMTRIAETLREAESLDQFSKVMAEHLSGPMGESLVGKSGQELYSSRDEWLRVEKKVLHRSDWYAAGLVILLYLLTALPAVLPLMLIEDNWWAVRISNSASTACMFIVGALFGRWSEIGTWTVAFATAALGILMTGLCLWLGG